MRHNLSVTPQAALLTDILLVDRCKDGDTAATRALFRQYKKRMHATLYRILGNTADVEDLMQESFIQVFKSLPSFRGEAKLSTWIDRITVRVAFHHIRRKKKQPLPVGGMDDFEMHRSGASEEVASREGVRRLYKALATLPAASRIAFVLHEIDGRSVSEVAEIVGSAKSATKVRIWRARRALLKIACEDPVLSEFLGDDVAVDRMSGEEGDSF